MSISVFLGVFSITYTVTGFRISVQGHIVFWGKLKDSKENCSEMENSGPI